MFNIRQFSRFAGYRPLVRADQVFCFALYLVLMLISVGRKLFSREDAVNTESKNHMSNTRPLLKLVEICPYSTGSQFINKIYILVEIFSKYLFG